MFEGCDQGPEPAGLDDIPVCAGGEHFSLYPDVLVSGEDDDPQEREQRPGCTSYLRAARGHADIHDQYVRMEFAESLKATGSVAGLTDHSKSGDIGEC